MEEQGVVVLGADRRTIELVVVDVLQTKFGIEPRPARRFADAERNVVKLGDPAVAVRAVVRECRCGVYARVGSTPDIEILTGDRDAVVAAKGKLSRQPKGVEFVGRIGRALREGRIQPLKLAYIVGAQRHPVIRTLILVL